MKKFNLFKMLAVLIVLITSINTAWAWSGLHVRSGSYYGGWGYTAEQMTFGDEANKYWDLAHTGGTFYWRLRTDYFNHDVGPYKNNQVMNVGTTGYKVVNTGTNAFATTANAGIIRIQTSQNHDGASDEYPNVWVTRPTVKFKYDFNNDGEASWEKVDATDNNDGTYTYKGLYCGTDFFCAGPNDGDKKAHESGPTTITGSPKSGQRCEFKWNCSGYKYVGNEDQNCGMFYITKLDSIIYDANGATKGSVPAIQEFVHGGSATLASNSGNLERVGYKFAGWYTNTTGTGGTGYTTGQSVSLGTTTTLYAKWEAADSWRIKGAKISEGGTDHFGNWAEQNFFTYSSEHALVWSVNLDASQKYEFGIVKKSNGVETWYGNSWHIDATTPAQTLSDNEWEFTTSGGNCTLNVGAAGTYIFTIDITNSNPRLRVYYPDEAAKAFLTPKKYIYLDGSSHTGWRDAGYTARFWFKATTDNVQTSPNIQCKYSNDLGVNYMYYVEIPDNNYIDRLQLNRIDPNNDGDDQGFWSGSEVRHAYTRSSTKQNCLILPDKSSDQWGGIALSWGTYCPPMESATLAHNDGEHTTAIYGGDGSDENPYLVATSSSIYVSATSESKLDDDNMTPYYQFKKAGSNDGEESSTATHTYTASGSNGTKEAMTVVARNYYYTTDAFYGTASPTSNSIYYESRTPYSVDVSGLTHMTVASGRTGSAAIVHGVEYVATLDSTVGYNRPTSVTVTCAGSDISAHCTWVKASGVLTIPAAYVTGNIAITAAGVAKTYTDDNNLDKNGGTSHGKYTATYEATSIVINTPPTYTGYTRDGYYGEAGLTTYIADAEGHLQASKNVGGYAVTDEDAQWKRDANITLYTKWTPNPYTITLTPDLAPSTGTSGTTSIDVTYDATTGISRITTPTREGYTFAGYYDGSSNKVIDENGDFTTAGGYISDGKYVYAGNLTLTAHWTDDGIYYFSGATDDDWTNATNWTKGAVPSAVTDQVRLLADATIPTGTTVKVASVDIATSGSYTPNGAEAISANGHLTISRGAALIASGTVQVNAAPGFSSAANTTSEDLLIRSDEYDPSGKTHTTNGTGTLIMGSNAGNTGATVEMFTLACYKEGVGSTDADRFVNQFVGTPFNDETSVGNYNYDGYQLYQFCPAQDGTYGGTNTWWNKLAASDGMTPFYGYNLMSYGHKTPSTLSMSGTLVSNSDKVLDLYYSASNNKENLFANPWTAPIDIKAFETSDFGGGKATIYIFNAGTPNEQANYDMDDGGAANATNPGQYIVLPIASSTWEGETALTQIPSMQAFSVFSTAASQKLTLDYTKLVSTPAATNAIQPYMRAPKRVEGQPETIRIRVSEENGWADKINIYIREDFTTGFDNGYDGDRISGEPEAPELYSMSNEGPMTVNCISDAEGTVVGFRKGSANTAYTMNFEYLGENAWYLNDTKKETSTLISEDNSYSFDATANDGARFVISKSPIQKVPTGVDEISDSSKARKQMIDGTLYIIRDGRIYNAEGSLVK